MVSSSVARRYARALLSLGLEDGRYEAWATELERLQAAFESSAELQDLWLNPAHERGRGMKAVEALAGPLKLSPEVANLLRLLVERRRVGTLPDLVRAYRAMVDERVGRVRAVVTTAVPMSPEIIGRIGEALGAAAKRAVELETKVDPALLGGVVATVGNTVLDGSLRSQLQALREQMRAAPMEKR